MKKKECIISVDFEQEDIEDIKEEEVLRGRKIICTCKKGKPDPLCEKHEIFA